jgi:hypothetical protein
VDNISKEYTIYATGVNTRQDIVNKEYRGGSSSPN